MAGQTSTVRTAPAIERGRSASGDHDQAVCAEVRSASESGIIPVRPTEALIKDDALWILATLSDRDSSGEEEAIMRCVAGVLPVVLGILVATCSAAQAGKNAGGAMVVHTDDEYAWTTGACANFDSWVPQSCDSLNTRTDNDDETPALIWFIAAFPDTADPGVTVAYFGIDHNLPAYYIDRHGYCGPSGTIEVPDTGWPDDTDAGNSVAFGSAVTSDSLFPFYWFSAYGFENAYLGTAENPTGGYAAFVDDSNPPVQDEVTRFGTVRWYAAGSNDCSSGEEDGGGGSGGDGQDSEEDEEDWQADQWLDDDGDRQWLRDCILVRLREDLLMPPRNSVDALGISSFDELGRELGLVSVRRVLRLDDEACSRFPLGSRLITLHFGAGTDELAVAREFEQLAEVVYAGPDYAYTGRVFGEDLEYQWHLSTPGNEESCFGDPQPDSMCAECDIGVDEAWQLTRGDPRVIVAFIDEGADMQHPDLFDTYMVNPHQGTDSTKWEDRNGNGVADLCADSLGGDLDGLDNDSSGVVDDVLLGWKMELGVWPDTIPWHANWKHDADAHGTAVAGILGAITNNGIGVASVAGGDANTRPPSPGVRLIQFSFSGGVPGGLFTSALIATFYYARAYGARVYSSSANPDAEGDVPTHVAALADSMLFVQAAGNSGGTPMRSEFARLPGVMAVGGYEAEFGGRWIVPPDDNGIHQRAHWKGSDYGPELSVLGPTDDNNIYGGNYRQIVLTSTGVTNWPYGCDPAPEDYDSTGCFGGTSAATPIVASVAALVFSYSDEHELNLSPAKVRTIIERTAEDIQCDPDSIGLPGCDCSDPQDSCAVKLLGWDQYTGYGRVDAGRALTLPVAILDPISSPYWPWITPGDTVRVSWEAFDINTENDTPVADSARFDLHFLAMDEGLDDGWYVIADSLPPTTGSYDWVIPLPPDSLPVSTGNIRIRLKVVDSGGNANQDYSEVLSYLQPSATDVEAPSTEPLATVFGVAPNPSSHGALIHYSIGVPTKVRVGIFDVSGRLVRTLANDKQAPGKWTLQWDGRNDSGHRVASGLYLIRFDTGSETKTVRLVRIR